MQMMISIENDDFCIQSTALEVLQKVSEAYIISFLESKNI